QAVTHAWHPVQRARSIVIAQRRFAIWLQFLGSYIPISLVLIDDWMAPCASAATGDRSPGRYSCDASPGILSGASGFGGASSSSTVIARAMPRLYCRDEPSTVTTCVNLPVWVTLTLVDAQRKPPEAGSKLAGSRSPAFDPTLAAYRPYVVCPCPNAMATVSAWMPMYT